MYPKTLLYASKTLPRTSPKLLSITSEVLVIIELLINDYAPTGRVAVWRPIGLKLYS